MSDRHEFLLLAFGSAAEVLGFHERRTPCDGRPLAALLDDLERNCPLFAEGRGRLRLAINERYVDESAVPSSGDEVALIPPVSGGSAGRPAINVRLTRAVIDSAALLDEVQSPDHGAASLFLGVVRAESHPDGRELQALDYTAYESMAVVELQRIAEAILAAHPIGAIRIEHRLGVLRLGETSVAVAVGGPHRAETFAACSEAIERLKETVPIFKREIWTDGSASWVTPSTGRKSS